MPKYRVSLRDPSRLASTAVAAAGILTPALRNYSVNSNFIPNLDPLQYQTVSTLPLPAGRTVNYRGWVHISLNSNDLVTRLDNEAILIRLITNADVAFGGTQVNFKAAPAYQWFQSFMLSTDINITPDITTLRVQIYSGASTSVVPLTVRSTMELLPVVVKQLK